MSATSQPLAQGFPPGISFPSLHSQSYYDRARGSRDRRHRLTLDANSADKPTQRASDDEHKNDQPPHAETQESSPGM